LPSRAGEEIPQKNIFFGISEAAQANFSWALIFWLLLYQDKSNKQKYFLLLKKACPATKYAG